MALVIGLDVGTRTVKGAVLAGKPGKFRLADFFVEEIPRIGDSGPETAPAEKGPAAAGGGDGDLGTPLGLEEFLKKLLAARGLGTADCVAAVETKDCVIREIYVPFTRDEQIRKTVLFEAEGHYPGIDLEEAVLEYVKLGEVKGRSQLVLMALSHQVIDKKLRVLKACGVDPVALDLDSAALFNAFAQTATFDPQVTTLLVDLGGTSTKILLIEGGRLRKIRALRLDAAPVGAGRLIPEPAAAAAVGSGSPAVSLEVVASGEASQVFDDLSLEARFREIENALRRLEPLAGGEIDLSPETGGGSSAGAEGEPIAVVSDDDYLLLKDDGGGGGAGADAGTGGAGDGGAGARGTAEALEPAVAYASRFPGGGRGNGFDYRQYLERVALEVQRSMAGVALASPLELICLTGGLSGREEARSFFAEEFDVETIDLDLGDRFPVAEAVDRAALNRFGAVAVGLGLKELGGDRVGVDFRKGRYRYEHRFERLRFPLLVASGMCLLLFLQGFFWSFRDYQTASLRQEHFRRTSADVYEAFFGEKPAGEGQPLQAARAQQRQWKGKGGGQVDHFLDMAAALRNFSEVMKDTGIHFELSQMDFKYRVRPPRVASGTKSSGRKVLPKAERSQAVLTTERQGSWTELERAFKSPRSTFYDAEASEQSGQGKYRVTLFLNVKTKKLLELEQ